MSERPRANKERQDPPSFLPSSDTARNKRIVEPLASDQLDTKRARRSGNTAHSTSNPVGTKSVNKVHPRTTQSRLPVAPSQTPAPRTKRVSTAKQISERPLRPATRLSNLDSTGQLTSVRKAPRHRIRKIIAFAVIVVLCLALFGIGSTWIWADNQLQHKDMLTGKASGTATSWLILGSDERDGTEGTGTTDGISGFRTDTILVLTKPRHGASSLISIPRDSLVTLNGQGMKINAAANLGSYKDLTNQVETISGHKIDHVVTIRFGGLAGIVEALGGVNLCYDQTVNDPYSGLNWTAGCHDTDGGTALAFSRMRYADPRGDFGRAERQRKVIAAITHKSLSPQVLLNISTLSRVANASIRAIDVDEDTNPWTLARMLLAFRDASSDTGVNGSVYWIDPNYYPGGLGSTVLLDDKRNLELFTQLNDGTHEPGVVGGM